VYIYTPEILFPGMRIKLPDRHDDWMLLNAMVSIIIDILFYLYFKHRPDTKSTFMTNEIVYGRLVINYDTKIIQHRALAQDLDEKNANRI